MNNLVFEWGTVPIQAPAKPTLHVLVNYLDVKGKLRLGEQLSVEIYGITQPCEIVSFELDKRREDEADDLLWIEVELLGTADASEGGNVAGGEA